MSRKLTGIVRRRQGWCASVRVKGHLYTQQFPRETPALIMTAWRELQVGKYGGRRRTRARGTLRGDVETFLAKLEIAALSKKHVAQLRRMLGLWVEALGGDRPRHLIEAAEIEAVLHGWLKCYKEPTVYHRRSALLSLFATLDGDGAANPVKETTCPKAWVPVDQSVPYATLRAIVDAMPDVRYVKKGIAHPSAAKLACGVIIAVGLRAVDLLKVQPRHFRVGTDGSAEFLWPASEKGKGVTAKWTPLSAEGEAGFGAYIAAGMPRFNPEAISRSFKRAAKRVDGPDTPIHLYTMRHSVGADLYRTTRDLATVGRLLNHAPGSRATAQYAQGANADVDRAAVAALSAGRESVPSVSRKVSRGSKSRKRKALRRVS